MDNPVCKDYAIQHPGPKHTSYEYGTVPVRGLYEYQCTGCYIELIGNVQRNKCTRTRTSTVFLGCATCNLQPHKQAYGTGIALSPSSQMREGSDE